MYWRKDHKKRINKLNLYWSFHLKYYMKQSTCKFHQMFMLFLQIWGDFKRITHQITLVK